LLQSLTHRSCNRNCANTKSNIIDRLRLDKKYIDKPAIFYVM